MALNIPTPRDLATILLVGTILSAIIYMGLFYITMEPVAEDYCEYEATYLHVSGDTLKKDIYCPCSGFYHWQNYTDDGAYVSRIPFSNGDAVEIIGATDIFAVKKKTPNQ